MSPLLTIIWVVALLFWVLPPHAKADQTPCNSVPMPITGECLTVKGRLAFYNGTPSFRIWVLGSQHLLGVSDAWATHGEAVLPANVAKLIPNENPSDVEVLGDFTVCPLAPARHGVMQPVCIREVRNVSVVR